MRSWRSKKTLVSFISEDCKKTLSRLTPFSVPFHNSLMAALGLVIFTFTFFPFWSPLELVFSCQSFSSCFYSWPLVCTYIFSTIFFFVCYRSFVLVYSLQSLSILLSIMAACLYLHFFSNICLFVVLRGRSFVLVFFLHFFRFSIMATSLYISLCFPFNSFSFPSWPTCTSSYFINSFSFLHGR